MNIEIGRACESLSTGRANVSCFVGLAVGKIELTQNSFGCWYEAPKSRLSKTTMTQRYLESHPGDFSEICIAEADKGSFETMASKHCRRMAAEEAAVSPNWSMSTEVPL